MNYHVLLKDGTVKSFKNICHVNVEEDMEVVLTTDSGDILAFSENEIIIHGDDEKIKAVIELFKVIDRFISIRVKAQTQKGLLIGYITGYLNL
ncbi:MAG: hypothetical protein KAX49_17280 [Halanaerobiales bacterium]|nr:hypothetical protein [Halanaerobiales bacterium]